MLFEVAHHIPWLGVDNDDLSDIQIKLVVPARVNEEWKQAICVPKARKFNTEFAGAFVLSLLPLLINQRRSELPVGPQVCPGLS